MTSNAFTLHMQLHTCTVLYCHRWHFAATRRNWGAMVAFKLKNAGSNPRPTTMPMGSSKRQTPSAHCPSISCVQAAVARLDVRGRGVLKRHCMIG
eukprot:297223-Pleurochrysis_carterae.AAC.5